MEYSTLIKRTIYVGNIRVRAKIAPVQRAICLRTLIVTCVCSSSSDSDNKRVKEEDLTFSTVDDMQITWTNCWFSLEGAMTSHLSAYGFFNAFCPRIWGAE